MSPSVLDRVYIKTGKSRSASEYLSYPCLWLTEADAFSLASFSCPTEQPLHRCCSSRTGSSSQHDDTNSRTCHPPCPRTDRRGADTILLCPHTGSSAAAAANPRQQPRVRWRQGKGEFPELQKDPLQPHIKANPPFQSLS